MRGGDDGEQWGEAGGQQQQTKGKDGGERGGRGGTKERAWPRIALAEAAEGAPAPQARVPAEQSSPQTAIITKRTHEQSN